MLDEAGRFRSIKSSEKGEESNGSVRKKKETLRILLSSQRESECDTRKIILFFSGLYLTGKLFHEIVSKTILNANDGDFLRANGVGRV